MYITKEMIIDHVNKNDRDFFYDLYNGECPNEYRSEFKVVYDQHWGDGNDYKIAIFFINHNLNILLDGSYSSWDSPHWSKVSFAKPYEYKETRYKAIQFEDIRDEKIETILNKENEQ